MKLSKRLKCIADMIPNDSKVIDVGCDHGYLSIYLSLNKGCKCIAADINKNALKSSETNIKRFNVDNIELKLTDGLNGININLDDYIVLAGMGTTTIINILYNKSLSDNLIISSNNQLFELRQFITSIGYIIDNEEFIEENDKKYIIIKFKRGNKKYTKLDLVYGPIVKNNIKYLTYELEKLECISNKIVNSSSIVKKENNKKIHILKDMIKEIEK